MFRRNLIPVWIGVILLSGIFLMGQDTWAPQECIDYDGDGYGNPASELCPNSGWDCNENNPEINPGVIEGPYEGPLCDDGADNDCDGFSDSFDSGCWLCAQPEDCDDGNPCTDDWCMDHTCVNTNNSNPCDDGVACTVGDACSNGTCSGTPGDQDEDGYGDMACGGDDCDDSHAGVNPGATEGPYGNPTCSDMLDNDCSGVTDIEDVNCQEDLFAPVIVTGVVVAGTGAEEIMVLTFDEEVCVNDPLTNLCPTNSADAPGSYYLNGSSFYGPVTVEVDPIGGRIVFLTAPYGFGVTDATYLVLAEVEDQQGNAQDVDDPDALWFAVDDQIAPVLTSCYHSSAPDINSSNPAVHDDGEWTAYEPITAPDTEVFDITCDLSEELDTGVSVTYSGNATCTRTGPLTLTPSDVNFEITCTAGVVTQGDRIDILGWDLAGNPLSPPIVLLELGGGTNIDPIFPPNPPPQ